METHANSSAVILLRLLSISDIASVLLISAKPINGRMSNKGNKVLISICFYNMYVSILNIIKLGLKFI